MLAGVDDIDYYGLAINALYATCLLAPESVETSTRDLWGNVKILLLDALSSESPGRNPWAAIGQSQDVAYASLTGLIIAGLQSKGRSNFTLESNILVLRAQMGLLGPMQPDAINATLVRGEIYVSRFLRPLLRRSPDL
jgi:hypothetical protein